MTTRKLRILIPMILILIALSACSSSKYQNAVDKMEQGDYQAAIDLLTGLDYEDSAELLAQCEREQGMRDNADYEFLEDIEKSVLNRMESSDKDDSDLLRLVNTELVYVEKYKDATFYDQNLKAIASKYIDGLYTQKEAFDQKYISDEQIEWQKGMVARYEALKDLYEQYNFLADDANFTGIYISDLENSKKKLEAYESIEADLSGQAYAEGFEWSISGHRVFCTLRNNTEYTYSIGFDFYFYDSNDTMFESGGTYVENVQPGDSFEISVYVDSIRKMDIFNYESYFIDVKW